MISSLREREDVISREHGASCQHVRTVHLGSGQLASKRPPETAMATQNTLSSYWHCQCKKSFMHEKSWHKSFIFINANEISMHKNYIFMHENKISMHKNEISMHKNDIFMRENNISMHENEYFA